MANDELRMGEGLWSMVYGRRTTVGELRVTIFDLRMTDGRWTAIFDL